MSDFVTSIPATPFVQTIPQQQPAAPTEQQRYAGLCVKAGWSPFLLGAGSKQPDPVHSKHGFNSSTNDPAIVAQLWEASPNGNIGLDLGRSGLTCLDFDAGMAPAELNLPPTLTIKTSRGYHYYFLGTTKLGNMYWNGAHCGEIKSTGGYCLFAGSVHPDGSVYTIVSGSAQPAPLPVDIVEKLRQKPAGTEGDAPRNEHGKIPRGAMHPAIIKQGGKIREALGECSYEEFENAVVNWALNNCDGPNVEEVRAKAKNMFASWEPSAPGFELVSSAQSAQSAQNSTGVSEPEELPKPEVFQYPVFPKWILAGTSVYENYVAPLCKDNSRIDYFTWAPIALMMLNYLGQKLRVDMRNMKMGSFFVLVGKRGATKKSTCMTDAVTYMKAIDYADHWGIDKANAQGRSYVWTAGSPEGLGLEMKRSNCKNAVLLYDELTTLVKKASIESSNLGTSLLTLYESGKFSNTIKATKETYSLDPDSYTASLMAGNTLKTFKKNWVKMAKDADGLVDRFTFFLQPEILPEPKPFRFDGMLIPRAAIRTKELLDIAVARGSFTFDPECATLLAEASKVMTDRDEIRAEKYALYFAVDLGLDSIDYECIKRGLALVEYERAVKRYLRTSDAETHEGAIQIDIREHIENAGGRMLKRDLIRQMHPQRLGTSLWAKCWMGLINNHIIRVEGNGTRGNPEIVQVLELLSYDDDE